MSANRTTMRSFCRRFTEVKRISILAVCLVCLVQASAGFCATAGDEGRTGQGQEAVLFLWQKFERVANQAFQEGQLEESENLYKRL